MRILLVSPLPPPYGGIARWTENYLQFIGMSNEVTVVDTSLGPDYAPSRPSAAWRQFKRTVRILRDLSKEAKEDYDVAHINSSCRPIGIIRDWICAYKLHRKSVPFVFHCHCNVEDQLGKGRVARFFFQKTLSMATLVYVLNHSSESFCNKYAEGKTKLCPNSIDERLISREHRIREYVKTGVYVGHLYASKGLESLIATAKRYPAICFRVVGKYNARYNEDCNTDNLLFVGEKNEAEVLSELDNADLFLFPSHSEGFSIALLEAMARGLPVIATDVGANREMLEDKGGIIIDGVSDEALDLSSIAEQQRRINMSNYEITKVRTCYTHTVVFDSIVRDYRSMIRTHGICL